MNYGVEGYCFSSIEAATAYLSSRLTIGMAQVQPPLVIGADAISPTITIPLKVLSGATYVDIAPLIYRPVTCENPGLMASVSFDLASLDTATLSNAYGSGFVAVSLPIVVAMCVSAALNFLKGENHE